MTDKHKISAEKTRRLKFRNTQLTKALRWKVGRNDEPRYRQVKGKVI